MTHAIVRVTLRWPEQPEAGANSPLSAYHLPGHYDIFVTIDGKEISNVGEVRFESKPGEVPRLFVEFLGAEVSFEAPLAALAKPQGRELRRPSSACLNCGRQGELMADRTCKQGCGSG